MARNIARPYAKAKDFVHIDVAYIAGRSVEDVIEEASAGAFGLVAVGYVLVGVYVAMFFAFSGAGPGRAYHMVPAASSARMSFLGLNGII